LLRPDFLFSIQYRRLLRPPLLRLPRCGCINLHFGLLPRYGGCYPVAWAILNGEQYAGVTLHYMTERFDEGDVIAQAAVPIGSATTARELFDVLSAGAVQLFADTYPALCRGAIKARPQDLSKKLYYTQDSLDFERDRRIDWQQSGVMIQRQICAFSFEPFQLPSSLLRLPDGQHMQVTVTRTRLLESRAGCCMGGQTGHVLAVTPAGTFVVGTGDGAGLEIALVNNQNPRDFVASLGCTPEDVLFT
jgi:methionyl-tRNA formyltransferase